MKLALAGNPVSFLARERHLPALQERGFRLTGDGPVRSLPEPSVFSDPAQAIKSTKPDLILLAVKAYDVADAARSLSTLIDRSQTVVSFLNGVNNESTLAAALGSAAVLPATLTTAVQLPESGLIKVERTRGIGLAGDHARLSPFQHELETAGFLVRRYTDADQMKWSKLLTNIVSNASSAILGWTARQIFEHPQLAHLEIRALREAVQVMRALGFNPQNLPGVQVAILGRAVFLPSYLTRWLLGTIVGRGRGEKKPSFHHDIGRGRSEVAWLNGAVVGFGSQLGIATPVNRLFTQTLLDLVHDRRSPDDFINNPQALLHLLIK